jgi:hypothetical protein
LEGLDEFSLTNRENALIQPEKLIYHLLSDSHAVGKSKAKFFRELGFNEENLAFLEQELSKIIRNEDVTEVITNNLTLQLPSLAGKGEFLLMINSVLLINIPPLLVGEGARG